MDDTQTGNVPGQGAGSTPEPASNQPQPGAPVGNGTEQAGQQGTEPRYVTLDEVNRLLQEQDRRAQSLVDKATAKTQERIREALGQVDQVAKLAEKSGKPLDPAQLQAMKDTARTQALEEPADPGQAAQPDGQPVPLDAISQDAIHIVQAAKIDPEQFGNSPEAQAIKRTGSPLEFLRSVEAAVQAYKDRMASAGQGQSDQIDASASARIPVGPGQPGTQVAESAQEYWKKAYPKK